MNPGFARAYVLAGLVGVAAGAAAAQEAAAPGPGFPVGEELVYRIKWGVLPVGESRATTQWIEEDGRRLLLIRFRTVSNRFLSTLYPVDDTIESYIDPDGFRPVRFVKKLNEGDNHYDQETTFDWESMTAHWVSRLDGREKTFPLVPGVKDIPSLMYDLRRTGFEPRAKYAFQVMADEKIYALEVHTGRPEDVKLPGYGRVKSLKMEPKASFEGVFVRKGRMWVWVSTDPRHLMTQVSIEVPVARVRLVLIKVKGPGEDFWVDRKRARD